MNTAPSTSESALKNLAMVSPWGIPRITPESDFPLPLVRPFSSVSASHEDEIDLASVKSSRSPPSFQFPRKLIWETSKKNNGTSK